MKFVLMLASFGRKTTLFSLPLPACLLPHPRNQLRVFIQRCGEQKYQTFRAGKMSTGVLFRDPM
jgi:hypothetical protein